MAEQGLLYPPPASVTTPASSNPWIRKRKTHRWVSANTWERPTGLGTRWIPAALPPTPEMLMATTQLPSAQARFFRGECDLQ